MTTVRATKNNVLAGAFVLASVILAVTIIVILADVRSRLTPTTSYTVRFPLNVGAEGLTMDSPVKAGGIEVGRVVGMQFVSNADNGPAVGVDVTVRIRTSVVLFEDAQAVLVLPLLGSVAAINIPYSGTGAVENPQNGDAHLQAGELITGELGPPLFLTQAGYGKDQSEQMRSILRNVAEMSERFNTVSKKVEEEITPRIGDLAKAIDDATGTLSDVRAVVDDAKQTWPGWRDNVSSVLENSNKASARAEPFITQLDETLADARAVVRAARERMDANSQRIDSIIQNVQDFTDKLKGEGYDLVRAALEKGGKAVDQFAVVAQSASDILVANRAEIEDIVANARLAAEELKLTAVEVRHAPWKLLAKPTGRKDLENEVLYDAVREYALAVADLKTASASLEAVQAQGRSEAEVASVLAEVRRSFERYQGAERQFLDRWAKGTN